MTQYLYRILYRKTPADRVDDTWQILHNRSYSALPTAQGVMNSHKRANRDHGMWVTTNDDNDGPTERWLTNPLYEYKPQRYPLTQEWEDFHD